MSLIKTGPFLFLTWVPSGNLRGVVVTSAVKGRCRSNLILKKGFWNCDHLWCKLDFLKYTIFSVFSKL